MLYGYKKIVKEQHEQYSRCGQYSRCDGFDVMLQERWRLGKRFRSCLKTMRNDHQLNGGTLGDQSRLKIIKS